MGRSSFEQNRLKAERSSNEEMRQKIDSVTEDHPARVEFIPTFFFAIIIDIKDPFDHFID